jgi:glycerol-3-phosphate dehydrogenase (NAD(P)+)
MPGDLSRFHDRARTRRVDPLLYALVRITFQPVFHVYFGLRRFGLEHVPTSGPVILAANHRSFLDPFIIATVARRPLYYIAKRELFAHPLIGWLLGRLGAIPVARGTGDGAMIASVMAILERGDAVLIFPEGTRQRPGPLGSPRRGVGRIVLESGAPVVPVAIRGTDDVRAGWRIRPRRVSVRVGPPLRFPRVMGPSPVLGAAVTDRIWPCVELQWAWLGGPQPPARLVEAA